jgi:hypothetical protein
MRALAASDVGPETSCLSLFQALGLGKAPFRIGSRLKSSEPAAYLIPLDLRRVDPGF